MPDSDGFDLIRELNPDGSREKEVFARFGRTAYQAQVFDHALVNLLAVATSSTTAMSREQLDATFDRLFAKTSGALVKLVSRAGN